MFKNRFGPVVAWALLSTVGPAWNAVEAQQTGLLEFRQAYEGPGPDRMQRRLAGTGEYVHVSVEPLLCSADVEAVDLHERDGHWILQVRVSQGAVDRLEASTPQFESDDYLAVLVDGRVVLHVPVRTERLLTGPQRTLMVRVDDGLLSADVWERVRSRWPGTEAHRDELRPLVNQ